MEGLAHSPSPSPDYVTYDFKSDVVQTPYFFLGYSDIIRLNQFGWILPSGKHGPNLVNRLSVRFSARTLLGLIPLEISEKNLESEIVGFKDGPIRAIKRIRASPNLPLGFKGPSNETDQYFYRNGYQSSIAIYFPAGTKVLMSKARFKIYVDFVRLNNFEIALPNGEYFLIYPALTKGLHTVSSDPPSWMYFGKSNAPQAFVVGVMVEEGSKKVLQPKNLIYEHGTSASSGDMPSMGTLSFEVNIASRRGTHRFFLYLFALGNLCRGELPQVVLKELASLVKIPPHLKICCVDHF